MGVCDASKSGRKPSSLYDKNRQTLSVSNPIIPIEQKREDPKLKFDESDDSNQIDLKEDPELDNRDDILRRGNKKELQIMVDSYPDDINEYSFGKNRTFLLEACMVCPNHCIIDMIMKKEADIDKEELNTGNTAIFLSALDLKVSFVRELLKYRPNLQHRNHDNQDIFQFMNDKLIEKRKNIGRELTYDEHEKYEQIINMLKEHIGI